MIKVDETLYQNLLEKEAEEQKKVHFEYLCLKNGLCPCCKSKLIPLQTSGDCRCSSCNYIHIG